MAIIDNNITFEEFRNRCEDKTTLTEKGQLHAATSETVTVNGKTITQTAPTPTPSSNSLLVQDLNQASGLNWKPVANVLNDAIAAGQETYAKRADVANDVGLYIDGKSISDIFESDGITAKKSMNAANTDFTNAEWIYVTDADTGAINLVEGATYEVVAYRSGSGSNALKSAFAHGFITYDTDFTIGNNTLSVVIDRVIAYAGGFYGGLKSNSILIGIDKNGIMKIRNAESKITYDGVWNEEYVNTTYEKFKYRRIR